MNIKQKVQVLRQFFEGEFEVSTKKEEMKLREITMDVIGYYQDHPESFLEDFIYIVDAKTNEKIPFKPNTGQMLAINAYKESGKVVVPKSRQMGLTTLTNGLAFHHAVFQKNASVIILSVKQSNSAKNLRQIKKMYYTMDDWAKELFVEFNGDIHRDNSEGWSWESKITKTEVTFGAFSANAPDSIRGDRATFCHWTETAFCDQAEEVYKALRPVLERRDDSKIVVESTSKGQGGWFYDIAMGNYAGWSIVFLPWYLDTGYVDANRKLSPEERADALAWIEEDLDLSEEQIAWYYRQVKEAGLDATHQEYPTTKEQSFRATSQSFFSNNVIDKIQYKAPETTYDFKNNILVPALNGSVTIWELPKANYKYLVSCDPSGGAQDKACIMIFNPDGEQVAEYNDKCDIEVLSHLLHSLARHYNDALVVIERNGIGSFVVNTLQHRLFYPHIFEEKGQAGVYTSGASKEYALSQLSKQMDEGTLTFYSEKLRSEMLSFNRKTLKATMGMHDDTVLCASFAAYVWRLQPPKRQMYVEDYGYSYAMQKRRAKRNPFKV